MAPVSSSETSSLTGANARVHELLDERLLVFLERVTALELDAAEEAFASFRQLLEAHLRAEEEVVWPIVERLHAAHGNASDPLPKHLQGDHTILERSVRKVEAALTRLGSADDRSRRDMVLELDTFLLLRRVLEHHDAREARLAYPLLDAHVTADERTLILSQLERVLSAQDR